MGDLLTFETIITVYALSYTQAKALRTYLQGRAASVDDQGLVYFRRIDVERGLEPVLRVQERRWQRRAG